MSSSAEVSWKLKDHPRLPKRKVVALVVLDGWGEANPDNYNCIHLANTPTMDSLKKGAPAKWRLVKAHGTAVGLPTDDDLGNSEVGHNALGAGRIYAQGAKLVDLALASGKIYEGEGFKYIKECLETGTLHLIGLLSDGGLHSRLDQLQLLLKGAGEHGAKRIRVHILTDGCDVLDGTSVHFVETLENDLKRLRDSGIDAKIASGGGRMYVSMDHYENDWDVIERGWYAHVLGYAPHKFKNAVEGIKKLREDPKANDQYLPPFVIVEENGKPVGPILDGDAVVTFNFRADRMVMLAKAFEYETFDKFDRIRKPKIHYAGMLQYDGELKLPSNYLVSPPEIERTSGEYLVHNGIRTFACSETVKFGHVTFFWNGNRSGYFNPKMEEYVEIPSDSNISFNVKPKMKAIEIAEKARDAILSCKFDQVRVNLPNGDMVGHTGDIEAAIMACEAADEAVKIILDTIEQVGGIYVVTADHGNAEDMVKRDKFGQPILDKNGNVQILTSHTLHPVPIAIGGPGLAPGVKFRKDVPNGGLANVAATMMNLHGFEAPSDYEPTLIEGSMHSGLYDSSILQLQQQHRSTLGMMHPGPHDPSVLRLQQQHRSTLVWEEQDVRELQCLSRYAVLQRTVSIHDRIVPYLQLAGFYGLAQIGHIRLDHHLITALIERWRPETHTFHLAVGEVTITLQDVAILLGLPVDGEVVTDGGTTVPWAALCEELLGVSPPVGALYGSRLSITWLRQHFQQLPVDADEATVQCHARAYILQQIGGMLMSDHSKNLVHLMFLPLLRDLEHAGRYSWGSATLAWLYRAMCRGSAASAIEISGNLMLLQLWAWERIPRIAPGRPSIRQHDYTTPLGRRWRDDLCRTVAPTHVLSWYRYELDRMQARDFIWEPYDGLVQRLPRICSDGNEIWTAVVPLVCFFIVEWHHPDRVLRQFGLRQPIPKHADTSTDLRGRVKDLHGIDLRGRTHVEWHQEHVLYLQLWRDRRNTLAISEVQDPYTVDDEYWSWYLRITRRFMSRSGGFVGTLTDIFDSIKSTTGGYLDHPELGQIMTQITIQCAQGLQLIEDENRSVVAHQHGDSSPDALAAPTARRTRRRRSASITNGDNTAEP